MVLKRFVGLSRETPSEVVENVSLKQATASILMVFAVAGQTLGRVRP
jgi:hypothetical protein